MALRRFIHIILNPTAGRRKRHLLDDVVGRLRAAGADVTIELTEPAGPAAAFARAAFPPSPAARPAVPASPTPASALPAPRRPTTLSRICLFRLPAAVAQRSGLNRARHTTELTGDRRHPLIRQSNTKH